MYIIPQPKKMNVKDGIFCGYQKNIVLDVKTSNRIFIAAQDLKKVMAENGFSGIKIVKPVRIPEKSIYLTYEGEDENAQGYTLTVDENGIVIKGESERGLFYGIQTLKQIVMQSKVNIPYMEIIDVPDLYERGYFHDVTRGRVPTVDSMKKIVDKIALYKYTDLQLYIEHAFNWEGFEEINANIGFLTAEEILEIDQYCYDRFIDLVPCFALLGHLYNLLQSRSYCKYCELVDYQPKFGPWKEAGSHHTIDISNPESYEILKRMIDQVIGLFRSKKFNINCDESVDMGKGRSKHLADKYGYGQIYVDHVNKLYDYINGVHGKEVMFWADIVGNYFPHEFNGEDCSLAIKQLPKDIVCLFWNYRYPIRKDRYKTIKESVLSNIVFCPWTAGTPTFVPRYHHDPSKEDNYVAYENIEEMALWAAEEKTGRYLLTHWGRYPHVELLYPIIAYAGAKTWNAHGNKDVKEFDRFVSKLEYGDEKALELLKEVAELSRDFEYPKLNAELTGLLAYVEVNDAKKFEIVPPDESMIDMYNNLYKAEINLACCKLNESRDALMTCVRAVRLIVAIKLAQKYPVMDNFDLANEVERWFEDYAQVWRKDNKEGELFRIFENFEKFCAILRTQNQDK